MSQNTLKKLFFSLFLLYLPLLAYSQSNRAESVALVPFWGDDEQFIQEFGEELFKSVNDMQGYRSVVIDMTNLPDDVPEGGFPPYVCPSPSLIKSNPIAMTGEMDTDEDDDELWILRLYLWEMKDTRLVFSDRVQGYDREEIALGLPGVLDFMFEWLKRGGRGSGGDGEGDTSNLYGGKQVFITTSMPLQWIYFGGRVGATPLRMQVAGWEGANERYVQNRYESVSAALSLSTALFPEHIPFFSRFEVQAEGLFTYDFQGPVDSAGYYTPSTMSITPGVLLKFQAIRHGNMLFTLFGGAYTPFPLNDNVYYKGGLIIPIGWTAGLTYGGKIDPIPGVFYIDLRYSSDEFNTFVTKDNEGFKRRAVSVSIGYGYGLFTKK
jgi:hypothetical protein